jgi:5-hydroxyisourate hydrolase-like protein (transthyretin family)
MPRARKLIRSWLTAAALLAPVAAAAQNGAISGTITDEATGLPIQGLTVIGYSITGTFLNSNSTNASGAYTLANLPPGAYYVYAHAVNQGYVTETYPDVQCIGSCSFSETIRGSLVIVTPGTTTTGRDLALQRAGRITGTITNAATGAPLANVTVTTGSTRNGVGQVADSVTTNASGVFTVQGLLAGDYFIYTSNNQGFVNEIYGNIPCVGTCQLNAAMATGTPIPVTLGSTTAGRDIALDQGGSISGTITNAATGAPIQNVSVNVYARVGSGNFAGFATTNASGVYTVSGLATGTYVAYTGNTVGFTNEIYNDILCPLICSSAIAVASGAEIPVTTGATTSGRDIALTEGGRITGTVTNQAGTPLQNIFVTVVARVDPSVTYTTSFTTNASGVYTASGLPTGTYRLYTSNSLGYINEIYDDIPCRGGCNSITAATTGVPVPVTQGATTAGRNFSLQIGGGLSGVVTDDVTGTALGGIGIEVWQRTSGTPLFVTSTSTASNGNFSFGGLAAGEYLIDTFGFNGYRNEAFDNIPCLGTACPVNTIMGGTPILVALGSTTSGRNIALSRGDVVRGLVTSSATGQPLGGPSVSLYQVPSGTFVASSGITANGEFVVRGVPNGNYVAFTSNSQGHYNEIYNNIRCNTTCSPATAVASGTPIAVTGANADAAGINFSLDPRTDTPPGAPTNLRASASGFTAQFSWTAPTPSTTGIATSYVIDAGVSPGGTIVSLPVPASSGTSFSVPGAPAGVFYVRVRAVNAAGSGPPSNEVMLVISGAGVTPPDAPTSVNSTFVSGDRLSFTWAPAVTGGAPTSYIVEAGSASGLSNIASVTVTTRHFLYTPVPPGVFFLRVRAVNAGGVSAPSAEVMIVAGGVPSPPEPPSFTSITASGSTVTLNWTAPAFGTPTSYIIEAGSATGLANLATVNTGNATTTASFSGVPSGTYYVRLRAVNAQGASIVSNERTVVVP